MIGATRYISMRGSLAGRVLVLLTIALLPIGLIAVYQTASVVREAAELSRREILSRTADAASSEYALIRRAVGASRALGAMAVETGPASETCINVMKRFVSDRDRFIFAGFTQANGVMECSSTGSVIDFSGFADWGQFTRNPSTMVTVNDEGAATGQSVMIVTAPVFATDGTLEGGASISIPHSLANTLLAREIDGLDVALMNGRGQVISATSGTEDAETFQRLGLLPEAMGIPPEGTTLDASLFDGSEGRVAIVPLSDTELYVVGKWAATEEPAAVSFLGSAAPAFPILMWLASLVVAYLAIDTLVLRHLRYLRGRMARFSVDNQALVDETRRGTPFEIREIARSYNAMAGRVVEDHARLEDSLREKELLLREVHHRVKNNLQLIASILNMQMRAIDTPDAERVLKRVQDRVMSLATIHKALYVDANVETVRADLLLREIIAGVLNIGVPVRSRIATEFVFEPVELDPDQAVPLSLLVTEAVTNAVKYASAPEGEQARIAVSLSEDLSGNVNLEVFNSRGNENLGGSREADGTGLGSRLIAAFVSQLGGISKIEDSESGYRLSVAFTKLGAPREAAAEEPAA